MTRAERAQLVVLDHVVQGRDPRPRSVEVGQPQDAPVDPAAMTPEERYRYVMGGGM